MQNSENILKNHLEELSKRADEQRRITFSDFLNLDEQNTFFTLKFYSPATLWGGFDGAERKLACFGSGDIKKIQSMVPVVWVKIVPVSKKFADVLSHRDFLGTIMGLGIRRETLGDIIISDNCGYVFCLNRIADYIVENLDRIKHTSVKCRIINEPPRGEIPKPDEQIIIAASLRLDAIIATVYKISRGNAQVLFMQNKVFVDGKMTNNSSYVPKNGEIISVRGTGRFVFYEVCGQTKKERLKIKIGIYK